MKRLQFKLMMEGLIMTAVEKIYVLGFEDAKEEVEKIIEMVEELDEFWNSTGDLTEIDWLEEITETVETIKIRIEK